MPVLGRVPAGSVCLRVHERARGCSPDECISGAKNTNPGVPSLAECDTQTLPSLGTWKLFHIPPGARGRAGG